MTEVIIPSLYLLSGVCLYACGVHLMSGFERPRNITQVAFGFCALAVAFFSIFHVLSLRATGVEAFISALRWTLALSIVVYGCLFWFIALLTQQIPKAISLAYALVLTVMFVINLMQPYTLQFDQITGLNHWLLPWGERYTDASGLVNQWFLVAISILYLSMIYWSYLLIRHYLANRTRANLGMVLSMAFLFVAATQGILVRLAKLDFVPLGMFGFLTMIIGMSLIMRHEARQKMVLASHVYEHSSESMMVTDQHNRIIAVNAAFTTATGYSSSEVFGKSPGILSSGRQDRFFYLKMWEEINATGHWRGEIWNKRKDGQIYPELLSVNTIWNEDGSVNRRIALFRDLTKEKQSDELIWKQANFDELTGLMNRRSLQARLEHEIKKSGRFSLGLAVMLLDLDRFKEVNDTLGHEMGDALLKEAGQRMKACMRDIDAVGRLGGDEFVIIMGELSETASIGRVANNLGEKLSEPYQLGNDTMFISASIGITLFPEDATDATSLMKNADQAMYAAKRQGRNGFHYYTAAMQQASEKKARLSMDMHVALKEGQFRVYYQPIVDMQSCEIHKAEALIRWQHPVFGLVSPAEFIPIAEETGQIVEIGTWVFRQAFDQVMRIRNECCPDFQISVNKSPVQFRNPAQNENHWFHHVDKLGLSGECIVVEITEGLLMEGKDHALQLLLALRDRGMQVALDDFGTGYSSLSYLKKFDIDYIKIDQSFVRNLALDSDDFVLCEAMIVMAHKLGLQVIAEGIETEQQKSLLQRIECDFGQGYLFSRPVPAEDFERLLLDNAGGRRLSK
jgi:diguanylate cyclase (GGDEF)-like protein/PAS domain S-box-containing protein